MFRTFLSIVVLFAIVFAQPTAARAAQGRAGAPSPAKAAPAGALNINTASVSDFDALPGIGAKTAALIVEYRQKNGPFKKVEELMNIRGIGEKNFLKLKPQLTLTTPKADTAKTQGH